MLIDRLLKVATPLTTVFVTVPESVPPPGLVPMARVMWVVLSVVIVAFEAFTTLTVTAGLIVAPAVRLVGCWTKRSLVAALTVVKLTLLSVDVDAVLGLSARSVTAAAGIETTTVPAVLMPLTATV